MVGILWSSLLVAVWACLCTIIGASNAGMTARSSDPNVQHGEGGQIFADPNNLPDLALGRPDSIETDVPGAPLSPKDFEESGIMKHNTIDTTVQADPIELAGLFQGDIMLNPQDTLSDLAHGDPPSGRTGRSAMIDIHRRWPNGIIPYVISQAYDKFARGTIAKAMSEFHEKTCIRFVPRTIEKDYIHILKGDGCSSSVGRVQGAQEVSLGPGCLYVGIVIHEFMHAAGFWHEQSRSDRDNYITINMFNVQKGMQPNFVKYGWDKILSLGIPYDLESVMHYGPYAFAKERSPTIIPRESGAEMGQRRGFSVRDTEKLQKLYNCANTSTFYTTTYSPIIAAATEECADNDQKHCQTWADRGECEVNPVWMNINCRKACRQCGGGGAAGKECQDQCVYCKTWSQSQECTKNPEYMTIFCKKSCGLCHDHTEATGSQKRCEDKNRYCQSWSNLGQCHSNKKYMLIYCKKSCRVCQEKLVMGNLLT
ncbi:zinc metalloproteinase nas-4-like isoform X1 [Portunus trituberculatus]|uniref:zinc metalloproteinase nas-4-like isoform X1 n=1 Tax=Portunus trituberculatus TaxID=210409 RepID=UPI001E1D05B5|nr:zinc metalloproteinase nas-4-like isoform X1 [Portunus trituberculatus]